MNAKEQNHFLELLIKAYEGTISPDDVQLINQYIKTDEEAASVYAEFFDTVSGLVDLSEISLLFNEDNIASLDTWFNILAEDEKTAPAVEIPKEVPSGELIQKVVYAKSSRHISKMSVFSAMFSAAAMIVIVLFLRFAPPKSGIEVATLVDSMNARWGVMDNEIHKGKRFAAGNDDFYLREGIIELLFDNGCQVTLEGPTEFQVINGDMINMKYGRVYAVVSKEAYGFQVCTGDSKIIDLGTEFGVEKDLRGKVELHVIKGKTCLISGSGYKNIDMDVFENSAIRLNTHTGQTNSIKCNKELFVRKIDSKLNLIWRGESAVIPVPNNSFEAPFVKEGESRYRVDIWSVIGAAGVSSNGSEGKLINQVSYDGTQVAFVGIDGGQINLPNRDGDQIAWMNTNQGTSLIQFLPDIYSAGMSYELIVGLARAAWNPPDEDDQIQIQFCYMDTAGDLKIIAQRTIAASEMNWSDGNNLVDFALTFSEVQSTDDFSDQPIGIRIISAYEEIATEKGDWVIDNVRLMVH